MAGIFTVPVNTWAACTAVLMKYLSVRSQSFAAAWLLLLLLAGPVARAQAPAWQTANAVGSMSYSGMPYRYSYIVTASTTDAYGNVYMTGAFYGSASFGSILLTSLNNPSAGTYDAFVAKYNPATGTFLWALRAGSNANGNVYTHAIAVSGASVYVTGTFDGSASIFGSAPLATSSQEEAYVAKLTDAGSSGTFGWVQRSVGGSGGRHRLLDVAVNGADVYLLGGFLGTTTFGPATLTAVPGNTSASGTVSFLAKFTDAGSTGAVRWARTLDGAPENVAVNGANVYVAGEFDGPAISFGATALTNANAQSLDLFIARLSDAGSTSSFADAQGAGGSGNERVFSLAASATGAVVTGSYQGPAAFGGVVLPNYQANSNYEAKWNLTGGGFGWVQRSDYGVSKVVVSGPSVYLAGSFRTGTFGGTALTSTGGGNFTDAFVAKFTDAGSSLGFNWVQRAGGTNNDDATTMSLGGTRVTAQGLYYSSPATFGSLSLTPGGTYGVFLASLTDPTLTATAAPAPLIGFALSPNPAHTAATLRLPAVPGAATATLTLLDALGRAVRTQLVPLPAAGATAEMALAGLAPGLYRVRVQAGGQQASRALAVE